MHIKPTYRLMAPDDGASPGGDAKSGNVATLPDGGAPAPAPTAAPSPAPAPGPAAAPAPAEPKAQTWPDTWRDLMAGELPETADEAARTEHAKLLKRLQRLNSPADAARVLREQDKLISSGQLKKALPKDATPEAVAEWRKENGIPESPDKYDLGLKEGTVLGDGDKALLDAWVAKVHGVNASPEVVKAGAAALVEMREGQVARYAEQDAGHKAEFEDAMRAEWGADYRSNLAGIELMLKQAGSDVFAKLAGARGPDGRGIANDPDVMRFLGGLSREMGFVPGTVVPANGDVDGGIDNEIAALEKQMRSDVGAWRKDSKAQARLQQLYAARDRRVKRAA